MTTIPFQQKAIPVFYLPHDVDVERSIIASGIIDRLALAEIANKLSCDDFYNTANKALFAAMCNLHDDGFSVDVLTLKNKILELGNLETVGGIEYLIEIQQNAATYKNVSDHIEILKRYSLRRKAKLAAEKIGRMADSEETELCELERQLNKLSGLKIDLEVPWSIELCTVGRFLKTEAPPQNFIIPGFLPSGVWGLVSGEGGTSGKSLALLTLGMQLAIADLFPIKWLDRFELTKKKTLYLSLEDSRDKVHQRIQAIKKTLPVDALIDVDQLIEDNFFILCKEDFFTNGDYSKLVDADGYSTSKTEKLRTLINGIKPDLVIIDTRSKASDVDENDNAKNSALAAIISGLSTCEGNPSVLLVSHVSKAVRNSTESHSMNFARGAGSLTDDARWVLNFRPMGTQDESGRSLIEIIHAKNSYGKVADGFVVAFDYPTFELSTVTPASIAEDKKNKEFDEVFDSVVKLLADNPAGLSQNEISEKLNKRKELIGDIAKKAIDWGDLCREGKGRTAKLVNRSGSEPIREPQSTNKGQS